MSHRQRSPAPPSLPPKDSSSSLASSYHSSTSQSRHINVDLAEAVRDSVQIGHRSSSASPVNSGAVDFSAPAATYHHHNNNNSTGTRSPLPPSLNPLVPGRTASPHRSPQPSPEKLATQAKSPNANGSTRMSFMQPQLPSQRIISAQNPFETDELDFTTAQPATQRVGNADGASSRIKLLRAQTG
jgi:hypothetical protein